MAEACLKCPFHIFRVEDVPKEKKKSNRNRSREEKIVLIVSTQFCSCWGRCLSISWVAGFFPCLSCFFVSSLVFSLSLSLCFYISLVFSFYFCVSLSFSLFFPCFVFVFFFDLCEKSNQMSLFPICWLSFHFFFPFLKLLEGKSFTFH